MCVKVQFLITQVAKDVETNNSESTKAIEIPPPRPKRKPIHPYPRKLVHSSSVKGITTSKGPERGFSLVLPSTEQENGSPKSVLSTLGSELSDSTIPNSPKGCSPLISSAEMSKQECLPSAELENGYSSSNEKEKKPTSAYVANSGSSQVNEPSKVTQSCGKNIHIANFSLQ